MKFKRMTVIERKGRKSLCLCECGNEKEVWRRHLESGATKSCGCLQKERVRSKLKKPEEQKATRSIFSGMKSRCNDPNSRTFEFYGGRGIQVKYRNFEEFLDDVGLRPKGQSIERIDNQGHYEKGNCRWATTTEQSNNKRSNVKITLEGKTMTIAEWCREKEIPDARVRWRLKQGWSPERSLS